MESSSLYALHSLSVLRVPVPNAKLAEGCTHECEYHPVCAQLSSSIEIARAKARDPLSGEVSTTEYTSTLLKQRPSIGLGEDGAVALLMPKFSH